MVRHFKLFYSATVRKQIKKLHPQLKPFIRKKIEHLIGQPYLGKPLERELTGYYSLRANRYRVIYKINDDSGTIDIHYIGHRKDIYELFGEQIRSNVGAKLRMPGSKETQQTQ